MANGALIRSPCAGGSRAKTRPKWRRALLFCARKSFLYRILTACPDTGGRYAFLIGYWPMLAETLSVIKVAGETMLKLVPISIAFGIVFAFLTHWSACNPGR